ncbi:hypothetical protein BURK2_02591 [Burkholderiales bacterium]|nr:hypothetical protein BURK2_02591 [Burkholderiales bacterium]
MASMAPMARRLPANCSRSGGSVGKGARGRETLHTYAQVIRLAGACALPPTNEDWPWSSLSTNPNAQVSIRRFARSNRCPAAVPTVLSMLIHHVWIRAGMNRHRRLARRRPVHDSVNRFGAGGPGLDHGYLRIRTIFFRSGRLHPQIKGDHESVQIDVVDADFGRIAFRFYPTPNSPTAHRVAKEAAELFLADRLGRALDQPLLRPGAGGEGGQVARVIANARDTTGDVAHAHPFDQSARERLMICSKQCRMASACLTEGARIAV